MIKNILIILSISAMVAGALWFSPNFNKTNETELSLDAKQQALAEWQNERLMDPDLGMIPPGITQREKMYAKTLPKAENASRTSQIAFDSRGPYNVGGRTRSMAYDVSNLQVMLSAGVNGGIWKTENNGATWKQTLKPDQAQNASALVQDTRSGKESTWYCATGEGGYPSSGHHGSAYMKGEGVYKSTDNGNTWNVLSATVPSSVNVFEEWSMVWNMAIDPSNTSQEEVYAAANSVIMRSTDGGQTWTNVLGNVATVGYAWVGVTKTGVVYAAIGNSGSGTTDVGIWRSTDGINFTNIGNGALPSGTERIIFDIAPSNENIVYFLMRSPGKGSPADPQDLTDSEWATLLKYEYKSGNGSGTGGTWANLSANIPSHRNAYYTFDTQGSYNMAIKVKPNDFNIVFIGGTNLFRSTDGFTTSSNTEQCGGYNPDPFTNPDDYRYPNQHPDQHFMAFRGTNGNEMVSSTDGGLHYTSNCLGSRIAWTSMNNGYITTQFYTVAVDHLTENDVVLGGTQDNGTQFTNTYNTTSPWTDPLKSDGSYCAVESGGSNSGEGIYYMSSQFGRTFKVQMSSSGTKTRYQRIDYPGSEANYHFINPFVTDYNNADVMYMAYENNGNQTIKRHLALTNVPLSNSNAQQTFGWSDILFNFSGDISALKPTRSTPDDRLYVGTSTGSLYKIDGASGGSPVVTQLNGTFPYRKGTYVSDIAVHPGDGDKIMVCFSNYNRYSIYYSEDAGSTWQGVAGNLEDTIPDNWPDAALGQGDGPSVRSLAILVTTDGTTYMAATSTGLYASYALDGHNTVWVEQGSSTIGNTVVEKLDVRDSDNYLAIATHGRGIYTAYIYTSDPNLFTEEDYKTHKEALKAFPNPAIDVATLSVENFESGEFNLTLFDMNGQIVQQRQLGEQNSGGFSIELNLEGLEAGQYFASVNGKSFNKTIKLIKR